MKTEKFSIWFVLCVAVFVTSLITANVISVKLIQLGGLVFPAGVVIFPISYIFGDVLTEVYGYRRARVVIWLGFVCNLLAVAAIWLAQILPAASFWQGQDAFVQILFSRARLSRSLDPSRSARPFLFTDTIGRRCGAMDQYQKSSRCHVWVGIENRGAKRVCRRAGQSLRADSVPSPARRQSALLF